MQIQGDPPGYMQVPLRHHHIHFKVEIEWPVNYPVHTQEYVIFICLQTRLRKICLHFRCLFLKISNPTSKSCVFFVNVVVSCGRSQWPRGLRRMSAAARLLRSWFRIPPGAWMFVCCECCMLSGRGLCDELITCPEESYRLWCVVMCNLETLRMRKPWPALGRSTTEKKNC